MRPPYANSTTLVISAGETSGDRYGAGLVSQIREIVGQRVLFFGVGGKGMAAAGVDLVADFTAHSVVASVGFVPHLISIYKGYRDLMRRIRQQRPSLAILIDAPTFNLFLAKRLKKLKIPVVYFVSPQVWAWGRGRIKRIRGCVRKMIVIFPFEEELYRKEGIDVGYFGHPLMPQVRAALSRNEFCNRHGLDPSYPVISLLPGSRAEEVANVLPTLLGAAQRLDTESQFVVSAAPNIQDGQIQALVRSNLKQGFRPLKVVILREDLYDALRHSAAAAVCSGTATLETAALGTPFVMVYRIAAWRWALRHLFVRVPYYCIVNLIAGRRVVTELMQNEFSPERAATEICLLLNDPKKRAEMVVEFARIRETLDRGDAFKSAAEAIIELMETP
jgi:lipid-A-disaccharide synthase